MLLSPRYLRGVILILCGVLCASLSVNAQESIEKWESFNFETTAIKPSEIQSLPLDDLKYIRGIIFGKHGRVFKDAEIKYFLESKSWYKANPAFSNSMLNDTERRNLDLIRIAEASKHETIEALELRQIYPMR